MINYCFLALAICAETVGTILLAKSDGFTRFGYTASSLLSYGVSFYFLSLALRTIPVGVAYALWGGLGIVLISIMGIFVLHQRLTMPTICGIGLIMAGIVVIRLFGDTTHHG